MKRKASIVILSSAVSLSLFSCNNQSFSGTIVFDLNGGVFPSIFNKTSLVGRPGDKIDASIIPNPTKEGYEFVGWRTLVGDNYQNISFQIGEDGKKYTWYPYGTATWYAYFEPQVQIHFDLADGTSLNNAKLVAPVRDAENFDAEKGVLKGYTSKSIPSTDYLPTATADHMTFEYWYTEYPLVADEGDVISMTHYVLDTSAEKGEYPFEESFASPSILGSQMVFPEIQEGEEFTLYAKWDEDPSLRIHYGLEGVEDSVIYVGKDQALSEVVMKTFEAGIKTELTEDGHRTIQDGAKRFDGFYTDPEFTTPFPIDTTTSIDDGGLDLYVKWADRLHLTFDYGEGSIGDKKSFETDDYYVGDILGDAFLSEHSPVKENSTFVGYLLGEEAFSISSTPLPQPEDGSLSLTFTASYDDYPELTIVIDYPESSSLEDKTLEKLYFQEGSSLAEVIETAKKEIDPDYAFAGLLSRPTADTEGTKEEFGLLVMPSEDTTLFVLAGYPTEVTIHSVFGAYGDPSSYKEGELTGFTNFHQFSGSFGLDDIRYEKEECTYQDVLYFFDGLYLSAEMTTPFVNASGTISTDKAEEVSLYQKFTKAITLTLVDEEKNTIGTVPVLPHGLVSAFQERIEEALKDYLADANGYSLFVTVDGKDYYALETTLPDTDSVVKVVLS